MTDPAWQRSTDLNLISRRLSRWRCPTDDADVEEVYDLCLARMSKRMRIVHRPGLPFRRSKLPWHVQQRRLLRWRTQGLYGSRDGMPTHDDAEWFLDLCIRVDARDAAVEMLKDAWPIGWSKMKITREGKTKWHSIWKARTRWSHA